MNYEMQVDELKKDTLESELPKEYWYNFILWLIEEKDFPVEEYFYLEPKDD